MHIPWSSITTAPVEVTFTGVECVLNFNPHAATPSPSTNPTPPATPRSLPTPSPTTLTSSSSSSSSSSQSDPPPEDSGGWASELITKIIANLSLTVADLSLNYLEGDVCACLRLHSLSLHSTDPSWRATHFMDLLGPWKLIHKALTVTHLSFFLYPDEGSGAPVKNERVCILQRLSISCRIKSYLAALGAAADISSWSTNTAATTATSSHAGGGGGVGAVAGSSPAVHALPRPLPPPCGPAITVDVHVMETVDLSLSSYQFERLHSIIQSKSDFYATSAAAARVAQSIAAVPAVIAQQDQRGKGGGGEKKRGAAGGSGKGRPAGKKGGPGQPSTQTAAHGASGGGAQRGGSRAEGGAKMNGKGEAKGWMSWMWDFVAAEEEEDEVDALVGSMKGEGKAGGGGSGGDDHRAEFVKAMGHLAPTDEIVFCFNLPHIALHIRSEQEEEMEGDGVGEGGRKEEVKEEGVDGEEDSLPSASQMTSDRLVSANKSFSPSPPRSYPLDPMNTLHNTIHTLEALNLSSTSSSSSSAASLSSAPSSSALPSSTSSSSLSWSSASSFASLHIHELAMILSQPLLLSKPPSSLATHRKDSGSPFRLDSSSGPIPSQPLSTSSSSSSSSSSLIPLPVKPPTFCANVVSIEISVVDSPSSAPRAVLTFGPEYSALQAKAAAPVPGGGVVEESAVLHDRVHVSKVRGRSSPFGSSSCLHRSKYWDRVAESGVQQHLLYALSIYHTVQLQLDPLVSPLSPYAACFDVLLGPLALSVDWSSAGTDRLIRQLLIFLKTMQSIHAEEDTALAATANGRTLTSPSSSASPYGCWLQLRCAVPSCGGNILGNPCPGHGPDGQVRCRKTAISNPCKHYTAHVEVACLPY